MKYIHIVGTKKSPHFGGATIGYAITGNTITYSLAICNKADRYVKAIGRDLVNQRFLDDKVSVVPESFMTDYVFQEVKHGAGCFSRTVKDDVLKQLLNKFSPNMLNTHTIEFFIRTNVYSYLNHFHIDSLG